MSDLQICTLSAADWPAIAAIYQEGIATGNATFETAVPTWEKWDAGHLAGCRFVAKMNDEVRGWAALSPVSGRCVYAGVAELSVYVAAEARRTGVGRALLAALIPASEAAGIWTLQSGIFPENTGSVELCKQAGFRVVGTRERLGKMHGRWRDVMLLERRSSVAGV